MTIKGVIITFLVVAGVVVAGTTINRALQSRACMPAPSAAIRKVSSRLLAGRVGMGVSHGLIDSRTGVIAAELSQLRAGGMSWIREDFPWSVAEPRKGVFAWAAFDRLMKAASLAGVHVLGILDYSTPWASSDPSGAGNIFYPPTSNSDFATYAAAVVSRYGRGGSFWVAHPDIPADPLEAVEIWNEPYGSWFWKPGPDPAAYAALVRATAPIIHTADPEMKVFMSGDLQSWDDRTSQHVGEWLARVLAADPAVGALVNGLAVHPYPEPRNVGPYGCGFSISDSFGRIPLIRRLELNAGLTLPIWITEIGWSTTRSVRFAVSDQTQAVYLRDAIQRSIGEWGGYVQKVFVYGWLRSFGRGRSARNYGLLNARGVPKPAWPTITSLVGGRRALEPCLSC